MVEVLIRAGSEKAVAFFVAEGASFVSGPLPNEDSETPKRICLK